MAGSQAWERRREQVELGSPWWEQARSEGWSDADYVQAFPSSADGVGRVLSEVTPPVQEQFLCVQSV